MMFQAPTGELWVGTAVEVVEQMRRSAFAIPSRDLRSYIFDASERAAALTGKPLMFAIVGGDEALCAGFLRAAVAAGLLIELPQA